MSKSARFYAISIVTAGIATILAALALWPSRSWSLFLACLALAGVGGTLKVRVPGLTGTLSPSFVPLLFAISKMSWQEATIAAAVAGVVQCVWSAKRFPTALQIAFNASVLAISSGAAFAVSRSVSAAGSLVQFASAALVFHVVNAIAVAAIFCLLNGSPLANAWRSCHFWSFSYHLAGGLVAFIWAQADVSASAMVSVLGIMMLYLMKNYYAEWVRRITPSQAPVTHHAG